LLSDWVKTEKQVSNYAVDRLLKSLKPHFPSIPVTTDSLVARYSDSTDLLMHEPMGDGEYVHFPWIESVKKYLETNLQEPINKKLKLSINVDGIPLYNNTNKYTAYPILVSPLQYPDCIICAGIYCSNKNDSKSMPDAELLFAKFFSDLHSIDSRLITKKGTFELFVGPFICDAPVRIDLKKIAFHIGYDSCERCIQKGVYKNRKVIMTKNSQPPRTNENFLNRANADHHQTQSIVNLSYLEKLNYPMVTGFILDYMHLSCLGIMKRLIMCWKTGKTSTKNLHFRPDSRKLFDQCCQRLSSHLCRDFNRKCEGGMKDIANWKASEYRLFMLYIGFIVLADENVASKEVYENFKLFSVAMKFLLRNDSGPHLDFVQNLLIRFITGAVKIYGSSILCYIFHCVQHLPEDYKSFGNLDNVSAFKFESYLGVNVKGAVRSGFKPLNQIKKHVQNVNDSQYVKAAAFFNLSKPLGTVNAQVQSFKKLSYGDKFNIIKSDVVSRDNAILMKSGRIAIVVNLISEYGKIILEVRVFEQCNNLFTEPLGSKHIGILLVRTLGSSEKVALSEFKSKVLLLPHRNRYVAFVLPHTAICNEMALKEPI